MTQAKIALLRKIYKRPNQHNKQESICLSDFSKFGVKVRPMSQFNPFFILAKHLAKHTNRGCFFFF